MELTLVGPAEWYVPDVGDNRETARVRVELTAPTVAVWRRYQAALAELQIDRARREARDLMDVPLGTPEAMEAVEGRLFVPCVGRIEGLPSLADGTPLRSGADLWAQRERLDRRTAGPLFADLFGALYRRATLPPEAVAHLERRSGSVVSGAPTDGSAETVASGSLT